MFNKKKPEKSEEVRLDLDVPGGEITEKVEEPEVFSFETTKEVSFTVNGKRSQGTKFTYTDSLVAEARKALLRASYGEDIIK